MIEKDLKQILEQKVKTVDLITMVSAPLSHISSINALRWNGVFNIDKKKAEIATVLLPS